MMLLLTLAAGYLTKKLDLEINKKEEHREKKLRKLETFHAEKMSVLNTKNSSSVKSNE